MNDLKKWLANHSNFAHTLAGAWGVATVLWASDPAFKNYIWHLFKSSPRSVHEFIGGIIVPLMVYWQTQKRTVVSAEVSPGESKTVAATAAVDNPPSSEGD